MNGRNDHAILGHWLNESGVIEVDYCEGGWSDGMIHNIAPHLKFDQEADAVAYVLAHGGSYSTKIPEMIPGKDYLPGG